MKIEDTVEIACTPLDLWPWLVEPERIRTWMIGLEEHAPVTSAPIGLGSTFSTRIREGGKSAIYETVVTAYDPPGRLGLRMTSPGHPGMAMNIAYRLTQLEERGTRLDYVAEAELRGLYRLMAPAYANVARARVAACFAELKSRAERDG